MVGPKSSDTESTGVNPLSFPTENSHPDALWACRFSFFVGVPGADAFGAFCIAFSLHLRRRGVAALRGSPRCSAALCDAAGGASALSVAQVVGPSWTFAGALQGGKLFDILAWRAGRPSTEELTFFVFCGSQ